MAYNDKINFRVLDDFAPAASPEGLAGLPGA
jgi:hypothetical protein